MDNLKSVSFRIDKDIVKRFKQICKEEGFKQGKLVEKLIFSYIADIEEERHKKEQGVK